MGWGRWVDARLLACLRFAPSVNRFLASRDELARFLGQRGGAELSI